MVSVHTQIEIAASPEQVKAVFFDWPQFPQWAKSQLTNITPTSPSKPQVEQEDRLKITVKGMTFSARVAEASDEVFRWDGGIPYLVLGEHTFRFLPSKVTPGGTTFINEEEFTGALVAPFKYAGYGKNTKTGTTNFDGFNRELKMRVESLY